MLQDIARNIYAEVELATWRVQEETPKEYDIVQAFNSHSYALILDNAESITGVNLAIKNTLTETERQDLQQFLQKLYQGSSKVIIGSRSEEKWLQANTFENNQLILSGLDKESAKNFADKIITELGIPTSHIAKSSLGNLFNFISSEGSREDRTKRWNEGGSQRLENHLL